MKELKTQDPKNILINHVLGVLKEIDLNLKPPVVLDKQENHNQPNDQYFDIEIDENKIDEQNTEKQKEQYDALLKNFQEQFIERFFHPNTAVLDDKEKSQFNTASKDIFDKYVLKDMDGDLHVVTNKRTLIENVSEALNKDVGYLQVLLQMALKFLGISSSKSDIDVKSDVTNLIKGENTRKLIEQRSKAQESSLSIGLNG